MSLLYYVSIFSFVFIFYFHSILYVGQVRAITVRLFSHRHDNDAWCVSCVEPHVGTYVERDRLCVLVYRKNVWLLNRLLKTQLNQMSWDCFKLDPWAVCGGCVCASVCPAPYHCAVPQWCMMLWSLVSAQSPSNKIQYVILGNSCAITLWNVGGRLLFLKFAVLLLKDALIGVHLAT